MVGVSHVLEKNFCIWGEQFQWKKEKKKEKRKKPLCMVLFQDVLRACNYEVWVGAGHAHTHRGESIGNVGFCIFVAVFGG